MQDAKHIKMALRLVTTKAVENHSSTLIFMHGLGDTGHGWSSILQQVIPQHMKLICPTANDMPVTRNQGILMPAWMDSVDSDKIGNAGNEEGILKSATGIHKLIDDEIKSGITPNRILLGGFSQGGALALYAAFTYTKPLAGVIALSTWLPFYNNFPTYKISSNILPIFFGHGDADSVVPFEMGKISAEKLKSHSNITFRSYSGLVHSYSGEELSDIEDFIKDVL